jgi:hypothetical protein
MSVLHDAPAPSTTDAEPSVTASALSLLAAVWDSVPLPALLAAANAQVLESGPVGAWFDGSATRHRDGRLVLVMPPGQPEPERDTAARGLLARMVGVMLPGQTPLKRIAWA